MNHIHRVVFNHRTGLPQVVSETAHSHVRGSHGLLVMSALIALCPQMTLAATNLPAGGTVTSGSATIATSGNTMTVSQGSSTVTINWQDFSIGSGYTVNFSQPSSSSIALNRVIGNEQSVIDGALNANGQVFLINSNGILFGSGSSVNVGGLVASTLNLSDDDFNSGNYSFTTSGNSGAVLNLGTIRSAEGGYVALLGPQVSNEGVVVASVGTVAMSSGDKVTLNFNGNSLLSVTVDEGTLDALVENKGAVYADGGAVVLTASAASDLVASQVNNSGVIQARTIDDLTGSISLNAVGGTTSVTGTLDASAPDGGNGGFIETSGDHVKVADSATITTLADNGSSGEWLIDPDGFTIGSSGDMTGSALSTALDLGNVTIESTSGSGSDGDVTVNDAVSWSADTTLTLTATNDININNAVTANGATAGISLNYGGDYNILTSASYSGATTDEDGNLVATADTSNGTYGSLSFLACQDATSCAGTTLTINGQAYTLIGSMEQLDAIDGYIAGTSTGTAVNADGYYALAHDLDASGTTYNGPVVTTLSGTLTGLGHTVSNLTIDHVSTTLAKTSVYEGLIGSGTATSTVRDIGVLDTSITTAFSKRSAVAVAGALIGYTEGTVSNAYAVGASFSFSLSGYSGGLIGYANGATLISTYADVDGADGGLIYRTIGGKVLNSDATGNSNYAGLIYYAYGTLVSWSYATGDVTTSYSTAGGLIASYTAQEGSYNTVSNSFATGNVTGSYMLGGLIGWIDGSDADMTIDNTYATGNVTGYSASDITSGDGEGGLIGYINMGGHNESEDYPTITISNSYATGNVTISGGLYNAGGLIGYIHNVIYGTGGTTLCCDLGGSITNSSASGTVDSSGTTGATTATGGLIGNSSGIAISDSSATGTVIGSGDHGSAGGLVGSNSYGNVSDSYFSGSISGDAAYTGGLVGTGSAFTIDNSYYNATDVDTAYGNTEYADKLGVTDNGQGLTGSELSDIEYYANGTIDDVLADRAAAAAAAAAEEAAEEAAAEAAEEAASAAAEEAARQAAAQETAYQTYLAQAIQAGAATEEEARRRGAQTAADVEHEEHARTAGERPAEIDSKLQVVDPASYSATVDTIEVNGKLFHLDEAPAK